MREFDEKSITQAVIGRLAACEDPRFARVMTSLVTHLHDFVREVNLTESEWFTAIQFLTEVGKACTDKRQEFILLSDTLGVSVLVITLNHPALFGPRTEHRRQATAECAARHLVGRWRRQLRHADPRRGGHEGPRQDSHR